MKTLGQIAYEAYCEKRNWKAYDDKPLPQWAEVKLEIKAAWQESADAVNVALLQAVKEANEVCRSAYQIAGRFGAETNWNAFLERLNKVLDEQHRIMFPEARIALEIGRSRLRERNFTRSTRARRMCA